MIFKNIMKIKPCDNLFLGSGKNFSKGENVWLSTRLMPYPSVFYGALCSLMLANNKERNKQYINNKNQQSDPRKYLKIGKIYLYDENDKEAYMPAPLDLFIYEDHKEVRFAKLRKIKNNIKCSCSSENLEEFSYLFFNSLGEKSKRVDEMFIKYRNFYNSYYKTNSSISIIEPEQIVSKSYKVGIERDKKNYVAKEGHLYRVDLTEFKENKWSYLVEYEIEDEWYKVDNSNLLKQGYLKLGGENKVCKFYSYDRNKILEDYGYRYNYINENSYIKIIFTSPCTFKLGTWKPNFDGVQVVGASTGKAYNIGGFDIQLKSPKPMYKYVPEGSVFILNGDIFINKSFECIRNIIKKALEENYINLNSGFGQFEVVSLNKIQIYEEEK